jgi:hypothetical protein
MVSLAVIDYTAGRFGDRELAEMTAAEPIAADRQ